MRSCKFKAGSLPYLITPTINLTCTNTGIKKVGTCNLNSSSSWLQIQGQLSGRFDPFLCRFSLPNKHYWELRIYCTCFRPCKLYWAKANEQCRNNLKFFFVKPWGLFIWKATKPGVSVPYQDVSGQYLPSCWDNSYLEK